MAGERQRIDVIFEGQVQGVGFRATACRIAERYGVDGWVANLPDGRVRLVAEGPDEDLRGLVDAIRESMGGYIRRDAVDWQPARGDLPGFEVRY